MQTTTTKSEYHLGIQEGIKIDELMRDQPMYDEWRAAAIEAYDVFDGEVASPDSIEFNENLGKPTQKINVCKATIMTVAGHSQKLRTDKLVRPDNEESRDIAEAANALLHRNWRMTKATDAALTAHLDQLVAGIGWVNVRRNGNRLGHKYVVEHVPWQEMKWDTYSMKGGFENCRWVSREQFYTAEHLKVYLPKHKKLIERLEGGYNSMAGASSFDELGESLYEMHHNFYNDDRKMLSVREVYERTPEMRELYELDDGSVVEAGSHVDQERIVDMYDAPVSVIKKSLFLGHIKIHYADYESAHPAFIPMCGYRKSGTNVFHGPVHDMIDPIYTYNKVTNEQLHILDTCKIIIKPSSLHQSMLQLGDPAEEVRIQALRRDGIISLNKTADIKRDVMIIREWENLQNLQSIKMDARQEIRDVSGIYHSFSGQTEGQQSGRAIENLAELGSTNMAVLLGNKTKTEYIVAEVLHELEINDVGSHQLNVDIRSGLGGRSRQIKLNHMTADGVISNNLTKAQMHITIADISTSAGYRAQTQNRIETMMGQLPPQAEAELRIFIKLYLENCDIPGAKEELEKLNMIEQTPQTPEEVQQMVEAQKQAQQAQQQMEQATVEADIRLKNAQAAQAEGHAQQAQAAAQKTMVDAQTETGPQSEAIKAEIEQIKLESEKVKLAAEKEKARAAERQEKLDMLAEMENSIAA